ncbi:hypothetical protein PoB_000911000 [Plakobranchus ocellatus]|uniref:Uncharacterized protein n=1 Tax=Plakobranchus ocellatus TaxID=259542 RepID=A0AAV3YIN3_9GAST|nr:hypothetical protein PoB_000911000 [Plakobranchus ocellatus]
MSDSAAAKRKGGGSYTEKDLYIKLLINLSRTYVDKEDGRTRIWNDPPFGWPDNLEWKNPTGGKKDTLPQMKKKVDYILSRLPDEKTEKAKKLKELAETGDGPAIHNAVCILQTLEHFPKIEDFKIDGLRYPLVNDLLRELAESALNFEQQLKNLCQERPGKRQLEDGMTPSQNKKPKKLQQKPQNKANHLRPICPKEHHSHRWVQLGKSLSACEDMENTDSSPSHIHVADRMPFSNDSGVSLTGKSTSVSCSPEISEKDEMRDSRLLTPENSSMHELLTEWSLSQNSYITGTIPSLSSGPLMIASQSPSLQQQSLSSDILLTRPAQNTQNNQNLGLVQTGNDHNLEFRDTFIEHPDFDPQEILDDL